MNREFWRGKRVLITGHTGFKGSWLSLWLLNANARVVGYSLAPPTSPSLFETARVDDGMVSVDADIRDLERVKSVLSEQEPEIVIHMAAQPLVRYSYMNPVETYGTNVMGTVNILEAVRHTASVRVLVVVTSDKCYENREWIWGCRESDPMGGHDPYSSSKGCAELVTSAYMKSFFYAANGSGHNVSVATVRAGNVIGGGDWASDRLIPDIMNAVMEKRPAVIRNPNAVRPWQHVLDPLNGYLVLAEKLWESGNTYSGAWNFGPDEADSREVSWIAEYITRSWEDGARWTLDAGDHPHEAMCLRLDCSKSRKVLGWAPKLDLASALQWVVEWYRKYQENADMRTLTEEQIVRYEQMHRNAVFNDAVTRTI